MNESRHRLESVFRRQWSTLRKLCSASGRWVLLAVACSIGLLTPSQLFAEDVSRVFAIPRSDLVFEGTIELPDLSMVELDPASSQSCGEDFEVQVEPAKGAEPSRRLKGGEQMTPGTPAKSLRFETREGTLLLMDFGHSYRRIALSLTLDSSQLGRTGPRGLSVKVFRIEADPAGGERLEFQCHRPIRYGDRFVLAGSEGALALEVDGDHVRDFGDADLVAFLWDTVRSDENALDGYYDVLYSRYGPLSAVCKICWDVLLCGTSIECGHLSY